MSDNTMQKMYEEFKNTVKEADKREAENEKPHERALRASAKFYQAMLEKDINTRSVESKIFSALFSKDGHYIKNEKNEKIINELLYIYGGNIRLAKEDMHPVMVKLALLVRQRDEINQIMKEKNLDVDMKAGLIMFGSQSDYMDYFFKKERLSNIEQLLNKEF